MGMVELLGGRCLCVVWPAFAPGVGHVIACAETAEDMFLHRQRRTWRTRGDDHGELDVQQRAGMRFILWGSVSGARGTTVARNISTAPTRII